MDFFRTQDRARGKSRGLVAAFVVATLAVAVAAGFLLALVLVVVGDGGTGLDPGLVLATGTVVAAVILLAAAIRHRQLAAGGGAVARSLGGRAVTGEESDPRLRRLRNVVEEMAIAAGLPVPEVFVLESEPGINAFAAGLDTHDAAVAVTAGALDNLSRDELQGVVGHEFSHILNGDMRLNQRLTGYVFGLMVVSLVGRMILNTAGRVRVGHRGSTRSTSRGALGLGLTGAPALALSGVALLVLGWLGVLAGRVLQAAVSRQREYLADAAAVQFTRDPEGLAGALEKIARSTTGSGLESPRRDEVSHMLFARGRRLGGLLATHPPLEKRIRALRRGRRPVPPTKPPANAAVDRIGRPGPAGLVAAGAALGTLPPAATEAARGDWDAPLLALALLAAPGDRLLDHQRSATGQALGAAAEATLTSLARSVQPMTPEQRLLLLDLAAPALRRLTPARRATLARLAKRFAEADGQIDPVEAALLASLEHHLGETADPGAAPASPADAAAGLLAWMATATQAGAARAAALESGLDTLRRLNFPGADGIDSEASDLPPAGATALLGRMEFRHRRSLIAALDQVARHDGRLMEREEALLRACCAALECPLPLGAG